MRRYILITLLLAASADAQSTDQRWNLYWQATSIGQYHPAFEALYSGVNSLAPHAAQRAAFGKSIPALYPRISSLPPLQMQT